jgi:hypothetical protein
MCFDIVSVAIFLILVCPSFSVEEDVLHWPQFRGPNATGIAAQQAVPIEFGQTSTYSGSKQCVGPLLSRRLGRSCFSDGIREGGQ